jgi:hypothetical protein
MLLEKLDICLQKTETRSMPVTLYKYQLKVDEEPKYLDFRMATETEPQT